MHIEMRAIDTVTAYQRRLRKSDHAVERMADAIREFGFKIPILIRGNGEIVDGHLRVKAAQKLGMTELPVIVCDEWTPAQVRAFRLMVNRSTAWATWDLEAVKLELEDLKALDVDLSFTGFDPREIDDLLFGNPGAEGTSAEVSNGTPVTRSGDLWICGPHRVLCGDSTEGSLVARLFGAVQAVLMVTDPPYGVDYHPAWREEAGLGHQRQTGVVANDDRVDWTPAYRLFCGHVAYVWHAGIHAGEVAAGLAAAGFEIRAQIIWAKQHFALSRGDYHWQHEPCWYAVRQGKSSAWRGDRTQSTLWEVPNLNPIGGIREEVATGHGTQKPVELMRRAILNHTGTGAIVYDPFLGSGTTLIAAEELERICYGVEIDAHYVDVIVLRWQALTGKTAILEGSGQTFEEVQAERAAADTQTAVNSEEVCCAAPAV
jgi:DNA modification methylase